MSTLKDVMNTLESLGSEQTRKTYARHGATGPMFGVKYGDLYKVVKQIGTDHDLALKLWETGNHDARTVAAMVADPAKMTAAQLDAWAKTATNPLSLDAIAGLAAKTPHGRTCFKRWMKSKHEWQAAAGWHLFASLAGGGAAAGKVGSPGVEITDRECERLLEHIEKNIHSSQNRVRYSMNTALIAIGIRNDALQKKAIAAAKRIGTVEVDHGDTACETPDAASYIVKTAAHRKKKAAGGATKKKKSAKKTARA